MTDTIHLGLPVIEAAQAQKHVTHNEALAVLDALVMLAVIDRDLAAPPASPAEGDRYLVKAPGSGAFVGKGNQIAHYLDGTWSFHAPAAGWTCYVEDEAALIAWDGDSWQTIADGGGSGAPITELQGLALLGVGTDADATNPFAAKLNNALWTARTVAEGGDGDLRLKLSKESATKTLSLLFQDNYSGRAEIGLAGDDDFHFKVSADGTAWTDALIIDRASGAAKINAGFFLTGDITPALIAADQNDYNPTGLAGASVLRLASDAGYNLTGLAGGGDGRVVVLINVGANNLVLKDASTASSAGNRFSFGADITLAPKHSAALWYDATDSRWKLVASGRTFGTAAALDAGATANKIVQLDGSARLPAVDGSQLTNLPGASGESDIQRRNQLLEATIVAEMRGSPLTLIDRWADGFANSSGIVAGSSSNYSVDTTNKRVAPTTTPGSDQATSGNAISGGDINGSYPKGAAFDNDSGTSWASLQTDTGVSGVSYIGQNFGTAKDIRSITIQQAYAGNGSITSVKVQHSDNGSSWTDEGTYALAADTSVQTLTLAGTAGAHQYWRLLANANPASSGGWCWTVKEIQMLLADTANNMTLVIGNGLTAEAAPTAIRVLLDLEPIDAIVLGTDYTVEVSRDGGTWTAATLSQIATIDTRKIVETNAVDVSGQPSGTSPRARLKTLNNKSVRTLGAAIHRS
jgi:hypothetical protein